VCARARARARLCVTRHGDDYMNKNTELLNLSNLIYNSTELQN